MLFDEQVMKKGYRLQFLALQLQIYEASIIVAI